jgi:hypothetical protein
MHDEQQRADDDREPVPDVFWMQLGGNLAFSLEVGGRIVGIAYWLDTEGLDPAAAEPGALPETGWYWVSVSSPRNAHRVAEGLELRREMAEQELADTAQAALEHIATDVLADGDGE